MSNFKTLYEKEIKNIEILKDNLNDEINNIIKKIIVIFTYVFSEKPIILLLNFFANLSLHEIAARNVTIKVNPPIIK